MLIQTLMTERKIVKCALKRIVKGMTVKVCNPDSNEYGKVGVATPLKRPYRIVVSTLHGDIVMKRTDIIILNERRVS